MNHPDRFLLRAVEEANDQTTVGQLKDKAEKMRTLFNEGVLVGARMAADWGREAGGAGNGGDGYLNLSRAIEAKMERSAS